MLWTDILKSSFIIKTKKNWEQLIQKSKSNLIKTNIDKWL